MDNDELAVHLDNLTYMLRTHMQKEEEIMALLRTWVNIGTADEPNMKRVSGSTNDILNDNIVRAYVNSGKIWEFLKRNPASEVEHGETFRKYVKSWISVYKSPKIRTNTMKDYRTMLNKYLLPEFGDTPFVDITTDDFQKFLNKNKDLSRKYLTNIKILFSEIAKDAVEDGVIKKDPTDSRKLFIPSKKKMVRSALKKEQYLDVIQNLGQLKGRLYLLMVLLTMSGLRRGEILGLRWEDFNWDEKYILVQRAVTFGTGVSVVGETKTESGIRKVPILKELREFLEPVKQDHGYVIQARGKDEPICASTFTRDWKKIKSTINIYSATPHVFRHTFLTLLAASGVDIKTIQAIAGHSNAEVTMRVYVHPVDSNIIEAGDVFSKSVFSNVDWDSFEKLGSMPSEEEDEAS